MPGAQDSGIWTPPITKYGIYYANRLVVLVQLTIDGHGTRLVPMFVDTGSPITWISDTALKHFGHPANEQGVNIKISGKPFQAEIINSGVTNKLLLGLNILGMDALLAVCPRPFAEKLVDAFNSEDSPAKRPRRAAPAAPVAPAAAAAAAAPPKDHDVLREFFGVDLYAFELIKQCTRALTGR